MNLLVYIIAYPFIWLISRLDKLSCPVCKSDYNLPYQYKIYKKTVNFLNFTYDLFCELSKYDLINGRRWDEE